MLACESARSRGVRGAVLVGVCSVFLPGLFFPAVVWAQSTVAPVEPPAEPEPPEGAAPEESRRINLTGSPTIDLTTPPPPAPVERKFRQHDGLYVRVGGGIGSLLSATIDQGPDEFTAGGATLELEALVGGCPAPGLAIGGGLLAGLQLSGDWESDDVLGSQNSDLTTIVIGPFADGYPHPRGGFRVGGLVGLASVGFEGPGGGGGSDAIGVGGAGWLGYDAWVAPEWSIGGSLRLDALRATNSDDDVTISKIGGTLSFSVLYN